MLTQFALMPHAMVVQRQLRYGRQGACQLYVNVFLYMEEWHSVEANLTELDIALLAQGVDAAPLTRSEYRLRPFEGALPPGWPELHERIARTFADGWYALQ